MRWLLRLKESFGVPFLILVTIIYWTQGFRSLPWIAISYQLKDELALSPSASQFVISVALMPWSIKPLYGILSDCVPIRGSRRISYLMISSALSFIPWMLLGLVRPMRMSSIYLTGLLTLQNIGAAMADVVIDAMIAEAARKERVEYAGDLQSMSWLAMALGGMVGSVAGGFSLSTFNVKDIFLLFSVFPLLQLLACGLIDERGLTDGVMEYKRKDCKGDEREEQTETGQTVKRIARNDMEGKIPQGLIEVNGDQGIAHPKKTFSEEIDEQGVCVNKGITAVGAGDEDLSADKKVSAFKCDDWAKIGCEKLEDVSADGALDSEKEFKKLEDVPLDGNKHFEQFVQLNEVRLRRRKSDANPIVSEEDNKRKYVTKESQVSFRIKIRRTFHMLFQAIQEPAIRRPMAWFFLAQISIPNLSTSMFYYQTNHLHLDASFLGTSRLIGWGALLLGTFVYSQYLKHVRLRYIFWWTHIALAFITLSDIILVTGLNNGLGIPTRAFVVGASSFGDAVNQFKFMPFLILSGRLCQPGIEGTLFALFMSLNNFGSAVSSFFGAGLASVLHISSEEFGNIGIGICIQALCTIIPIFFLSLIPRDTTGLSTNASD